MAKAKKKADDDSAPTSVAETTIKALTKQFGDIVWEEDDFTNEGRSVIPVSPEIDSMIGGGILEGIIVTMAGREGTGKTTTALSFAAMAQRPEYGEKTVYYISTESRLELKNIHGIKGLKTKPPHFVCIQSSEDKILNAKEFLDATLQILHAHPGCVVIFDSVSAMFDSSEADNGVDNTNRGGINKLFSAFVRQAQPVIRVNKSILICIAHMAQTQSRFGAQWEEQIAQKLRYLLSLQMKIKFDRAWKTGPKDSQEQIGQEVHWETDKSPLCGPGRTCTSWIRYGVGVDRTKEYMEVADQLGLINTTGAWYELSFLEDQTELRGETEKWPPKLQGEDKVYQLLEDNPQYLDVLVAKLKEMTG